ncbi:class I SAM-dependent methyltransferase [Granulicella sp. L60]|uniref:class I SAM-dependent methyltransferase n=1 Tax=Granulicella sp. L60 TaxID=1641866 RepID=UPI00131EB829|nr:class I SAM-dependent methyltransferase [Granulicella sp. L60]
MGSFDRLVRKVVPSAAHLSYNPLFKIVGDAISGIPNLFFSEYRELPPNHMRVRVGVNNKLLFNQPYHLWLGMQYWVRWLTKGYVRPDSDVVEIGCGCGRIAHPLRNDWFTGTYLGIDIDKELLQWCSEHFPKDKFAFLASTHKSATYTSDTSSEAIKFFFGEMASKDFIYSTSLYTHLLVPELVNYTSESFKVLREDGVMCMTFFCLDSIERGGRWNFEHKIGDAYVENLKYPEAAVAYTKEFMEGVAREAGFTNIDFLLNPVQSWLVCRK